MAEPYRHTIRIRYLECDPQGVLAYPRYLGLFDVAMTEMWRGAIGPYTELTASGVDLAVVHSEIDYRSAARFDDLLDIDVGLAHLGTTSFTLGFIAEVGGRRCTEASIRYVCIDPAQRSKAPLPEHVREGLGRHPAPGDPSRH
ncbi:MAG: acyl-CoA thioesterase [Solirubrobacterales bacterium]